MKDAQKERTYPVQGHIKDTVISLYHPLQCDLHEYKVAGQTAEYLALNDLPESLLGGKSGLMILPELVAGEPMIPVDVLCGENGSYSLKLADGCFLRDEETNQGYNQDYKIIAKVRTHVKEFLLAESQTAPSRYATWERTPANDGDGPPNYYWGHYHNDRDAAVQDLCDRAKEQFAFEKQITHHTPQKKRSEPER